MRTEALGEADAARWSGVLDDIEKAAAARFVFARHRLQYVAAHALARAVLASAASVDPASWQWVAGAHGKPAAWRDGVPAPLAFNISHAEGMVGVAVLARAGAELGFDLEPFDRTVDLAVAKRYFRPEEVAWLDSLAAAERPRGFMRLWTLKEAFIKATGEGLSRDLASFWFETAPPRIHFAVPADGSTAGPAGEWSFEQRVLDGGFVAACGVREGSDGPPERAWIDVDPATFTPAGAPLPLAARA